MCALAAPYDTSTTEELQRPSPINPLVTSDPRPADQVVLADLEKKTDHTQQKRENVPYNLNAYEKDSSNNNETNNQKSGVYGSDGVNAHKLQKREDEWESAHKIPSHVLDRKTDKESSTSEQLSSQGQTSKSNDGERKIRETPKKNDGIPKKDLPISHEIKSPTVPARKVREAPGKDAGTKPQAKPERKQRDAPSTHKTLPQTNPSQSSHSEVKPERKQRDTPKRESGSSEPTPSNHGTSAQTLPQRKVREAPKKDPNSHGTKPSQSSQSKVKPQRKRRETPTKDVSSNTQHANKDQSAHSSHASQQQPLPVKNTKVHRRDTEKVPTESSKAPVNVASSKESTNKPKSGVLPVNDHKVHKRDTQTSSAPSDIHNIRNESQNEENDNQGPTYVHPVPVGEVLKNEQATPILHS